MQHDETKPPQQANSVTKTKQPAFIIAHQYIRDLSFENPKALEFGQNNQNFQNNDGKMQFDVKTRKLNSANYEVALQLQLENKAGDQTIFLIELVYCALVTIGQVPQKAIKPILFVDVPHLIFPFIRNIIANVTQNGGYNALLIQPVNFMELFQQKITEENQSKNSN